MIGKSIIDAVINQAKTADKDRLLGMFIAKLSGTYGYDDDKVNHCLELLLDFNNLVDVSNIDLSYIKNNIDRFIYKSDNYIIKDIKATSIDNIEGTVNIEYKSKEKINEYRDDIEFITCNMNISFIYYPKMLKIS